MKKSPLILILLMFFSVGFVSVNTKASVTIANFDDPSKDSNHPLFTIDFNKMTLDGGWSDANTGLLLEIPYSGNTFENAWFDVNGVIALTVKIADGVYGTGPGQINFYDNNTSTNPLVIVDFNSAVLKMDSFGADEAVFAAANVKITGSEITGPQLSEEMFSFSFANTALLPGSSDLSDGFTATAAFTSSAVPEPATVITLAFGSLGLIHRKKRNCLVNKK